MADSAFEVAEPGLAPFNRKYLGSKRILRGRIADRIVAVAGVPERFLDGFSGTGSLALEMLGRGSKEVVAIDNLRSSCVILRGASAAPASGRGRERLRELLEILNAFLPREGYITASWAGTYFTEANCRRMDAIREGIEELLLLGRIAAEEREWLLACFLLAADRVANTLGQYDAFLKHIDSPPMKAGRHVRDGRTTDAFRLRPLAPVIGGSLQVIEADILALGPLPQVDVAYLDPPYNTRQYCDNYHVLENIARWEKPALRGTTRKFDSSELASPFCRRSSAEGAMARLLGQVRSPHLFLSYSSEGILGRAQIERLLARAGEVTVDEIPYPVFGNGAGVSRRRQVVELLFHVRMGSSSRRPSGRGARGGEKVRG